MMYFSRLKSALVIGTCLLGALLCLPNLIPAPAPWMPWRTIHLGLDLRGGSYLLLEVDMPTVIKERLDSLTDGARTALRGKVDGFVVTPQPAQNRVLVKLTKPGQQDAALAALRPLGVNPNGGADLDFATEADGQISATLSAVALKARAQAAGVFMKSVSVCVSLARLFVKQAV